MCVWPCGPCVLSPSWRPSPVVPFSCYSVSVSLLLCELCHFFLLFITCSFFRFFVETCVPQFSSPNSAQSVLPASDSLFGPPFSSAFKAPSEPIAAEFLSCLGSVIRLYLAFPQHEKLRTKTVFFLHRMVSCLDGKVIPYLPPALAKLLELATQESFMEFVQLISQIIIKLRVRERERRKERKELCVCLRVCEAEWL